MTVTIMSSISVNPPHRGGPCAHGSIRVRKSHSLRGFILLIWATCCPPPTDVSKRPLRMPSPRDSGSRYSGRTLDTCANGSTSDRFRAEGLTSVWGVALSRPAVPKVRRTTKSLLLLALFAAITACGPARSLPGGSSDLITRSQIERLADRTAFDLVQLLRPRWLTARVRGTPGNPTPAYAQVYVDGLRYGPRESLYQIPTNTIERIDYLGSLDATTLYGTGHMGGAIRVFTR